MSEGTLTDQVRERLERTAARKRRRRTIVRVAGAVFGLGALYVGAALVTLELRVQGTSGPSPTPTPFPETRRTVVTGVFSVHSERSHDALGSLEAVAEAAASAGLDFVYLGDHPPDDRRPDLPDVSTGFVNGVLLVPGQELVANDVGRVLAMGLDTTFRGWTDGGPAFAQLMHEREATAFVVHGRSPKDGERWKSESVDGMVGWEVMDMSETAKRRLSEPWVLYHLGTLLVGLPLGVGDLGLLHLTRDGFDIPSVAAFDSLRMGGPLTATAGLNHHPKLLMAGRPFPPYEPFFRTFLNHVSVDGPLPTDPVAAEDVLGEAVRAGRLFISLGGVERARGFRYVAARDRVTLAEMGEQAAHAQGTVLRAGWDAPDRGGMAYRILRDGEEIAFVRGQELEWPVPAPGIYRVEVYRYAARVGPVFVGLRPWIFTNPIELTAGRALEVQAVAGEGDEEGGGGSSSSGSGG